MNVLEFLPDQKGYSVKYPGGLVSGRQDGNISFVGRVSRNDARIIRVTWTCTPEEYKTLFDFYTENKAVAFEMDLVLHTVELTRCVCKFESNLKLDSVSGKCYTVSTTLNVIPKFTPPVI